MIFDQYGLLSRYAALGPNFETAVRFLSGQTPDSFSAGELQIDVAKVYTIIKH